MRKGGRKEGREGGKEGERKGGREGGRKVGREGGRKREGGREGDRERGREGGRGEGGRKAGKEGGREEGRGREGGREKGREREGRREGGRNHTSEGVHRGTVRAKQGNTAKAWFTIRRTATHRAAPHPCSQCLVLSGSERDVRLTTPLISTCISYVLYSYLYCVYALVGVAISIRDPYTVPFHESVLTNRTLSSTGPLFVQ